MLLKTLALIPARGGSKGIPRKNIRLLAGKPLIAWSIQAALESGCVDSVVVTTEDEEIAEVSRRWGAQVPFMRPAELAADDSPGMDAVLHAMGKLPGFDAILLLQPTSPLRNSADIRAMMDFVASRQANCAVSVCPAAQSPYWMMHLGADQKLTRLIESDLITRRQELPHVYTLNGALYFARTAWLAASKTFFNQETMGFVMPPEKSLDIDTELDWRMAELMLSESP